MIDDVPDPFESAQRSTALTVELKAEDVQLGCPHLSISAAEKLLDEQGSVIAAAMILAGIDAASRLLRSRPCDA